MSSPVLFQALPPLSHEEYRDLEQDILANGILVPIIVDENGVVIDGHHRQKIAKHHNLPCPREIKAGFTDTEKRGMALSLNVNRRHLTREQRRALVTESIKADPQLSDREHGRRTGVSDKTAGAVRDELEAGAEIPHHDSRVGGDGVEQPARKPRRKPITDQALRAGWELRKAVERIDRVIGDDRFERNKEEITRHLRGHLTYAIEVIGRLQGDDIRSGGDDRVT
jgi:ParB-like chromosome segregation protein Spo0J